MAKIPGEASSPPAISKTDIIRQHITAAIQMLAVEANPFSTHLVVMAGEEMIRQVAGARNIPLTADFRIYIKDEYHVEYLQKVRKAYNWFKHADRDAEASYDGPAPCDLARVNETQTLLNIKGQSEIGGSSAPIFNDYALFLALKYPQYMKTDFLDPYPGLKRQYDLLSRDPDVLSLVLQRLLMDKDLLPCLSAP
jgi:hypothetical protein